MSFPLSTGAAVARGELDPGLEGLAVYMKRKKRKRLKRERLSAFSDA